MKKSIFKHLALWLLMLVMVFAGACTPAADDSGDNGNNGNNGNNGDNTDIEDPWADEDVYTDLTVLLHRLTLMQARPVMTFSVRAATHSMRR